MKFWGMGMKTSDSGKAVPEFASFWQRPKIKENMNIDVILQFWFVGQTRSQPT